MLVRLIVTVVVKPPEIFEQVKRAAAEEEVEARRGGPAPRAGALRFGR